MLGNCEKMVLISANQWPQNQNQSVDHDHQRGLNSSNNNNNNRLMGSTSTSTCVIMNKPAGSTGSQSQDLNNKAQQRQQQQQHQQEALRCPRCDSSNTKFCYYNNYSLSQPRHFCKACKRYWTRGGTLRNVPVGGGCRKNKRVLVKRSVNNNNNNTNSSSSAPATATNNPNNFDHQDSTSSPSTSIFYGLPTNNNNSTSDLNLPLISGYDHHLQLPLGLGFSDIRDYSSLNGFNNNSSSNSISSSLLSGYSSLFGNGFNFKEMRSAPAPAPTPTPTASLFENLASSLPFDHNHQNQDFHAMGSNGCTTEFMTSMKGGGVKSEQGSSFMNMKSLDLEWGVGSNQQQNQNENHHQSQTDQNQMLTQSNDPNSLFNNWSSTWHDPANLGSSITSLI